MTAKKRQQDRADDGRYTFDGNLDRLCVCGHRLGMHAGAHPHDCLAYSFPVGNPERPENAECGCLKFRLSRRKPK